MDARLARLLDEREIEAVVYRYCRGIDRLDLELVRSCYHADATEEHGSFSGGVSDYLEWVAKLLARYRTTLHLVANLLVEFGPDPDAAAVESYGVAVHRGRDATPHLNLATGFRYLDRFERRTAGWRIAHRVAVSEWSIRIPEAAWWEIPDSLRQGRRDSGDALYALVAGLARGAQRPRNPTLRDGPCSRP